MTTESEPQQVLILDRQAFWRDLLASGLEAEGFVVQALNDYNYPLPARGGEPRPPDLVILGCTSVGPDEQNLIQRVLNEKQRLLVLCTTLPWRTMRSLFLAGAEDVADRTYDPDYLVGIVKEALESSRMRKRDRISVQGGGR
jgi:DNA-binding NtrC family response regulator